MNTSCSMNPAIIQGGMGFYISTPHLARTVSMHGGLGTVSGVALERVLAVELQRGDRDGRFRRALSHFPFPEVAWAVIDAYFVEGGVDPDTPIRGAPVFTVHPSPRLISLTICANFACVWLAKEGHDRPVSINYLEKIAMPHIYAITGAVLAGVDYITMGAGIPLQIPEVLNALVEGRPAKYRVPVEGDRTSSHEMSFDPKDFFGDECPLVKKPQFLPIVSSNALASVLMKRLPPESIYGFVIEEPTAGGHNAPPRGHESNALGEPQYGPRDIVDYEKMFALGVPFWIGGSKASYEALREARSVGASGIQVGTAFALCDESGMDPDLRRRVRKAAYLEDMRVMTHGLASPTGFPFKVANLTGTLSDPAVYGARKRACQHGALVTLYERADGTIGYRCPGEPVDRYVAKGGAAEDTIGRRCICSGLMATAGLSHDEAPIVTLGDDVLRLMPLLMRHSEDSYEVKDVFDYLGV